MRNRRKEKYTGRCESTYINKIIKCEWIKQPSQKADTDRLDVKKKKKRFNCMTSRGDTV